jgi:hypothetical protein
MALKLAVPLPKGAEYLADICEAVGPKYGISPYLLLGVCYAESNYGQALKPKGPEGSGDFIPRPTSPDRDKRMKEFPLPGVVKKTLAEGIPARKLAGPCEAWVPTTTGWGCGLMQFDYEAHYEFCKSGAWKDPAKIIEQAAKLLSGNRKVLKSKMPSLSGVELEHAMCASYNAGTGRVVKFLTEKKGLDAATFHPGYHTKICKKADELAGQSGAFMSDESKFA